MPASQRFRQRHRQSLRCCRLAIGSAALLFVLAPIDFIQGGLLSGHSANAQPVDEPRTLRDSDDRDSYGGVTPGQSTTKKKRVRPNRITWIGYQARTGGTSRLFVQLTSEIGYQQELRGNVLVVKLEGARYGNRYVGRRLDTRFFDTAVAEVSVRRVGKRRARGSKPEQTAGVELRIQFKDADDAREAQAELRTEQDGYHYLYLDFGAAGVRLSADS